MSTSLIAGLALISAVTLVSAEKIRYDGYHVISANIENEKQREFVDRLDASTEEMRLIETAAVNRKARLLVAPQTMAGIENMFSQEGLVHRVETTNLQKY